MKYYKTEDGTYLQFDDDGNLLQDGVIAYSIPDGESSDDAAYGQPIETNYYQQAMNAANRQAKLAAEQNRQKIQGQKVLLNQNFDGLAKQAYANYRQDGVKLPSLTSRLSTGTADSLALKGKLNYENNLMTNERQRQNELNALDSQINNSDFAYRNALASNTEKYSLLDAQRNEQESEKQYSRALRKAQALASAGDYSGYSTLGWTPEQISSAAYKSRSAPRSEKYSISDIQKMVDLGVWTVEQAQQYLNGTQPTTTPTPESPYLSTMGLREADNTAPRQIVSTALALIDSGLSEEEVLAYGRSMGYDLSQFLK